MANGTDVADGSEELIKSSEESSDNWTVECSDDESYNPSGLKGNVWEPNPDDIKELYEKLSRGESLELEWVCPGRRSPSPEKLDDFKDDFKDEPEEEKEEERALPKGFDFDEEMDFGGGIKPGSGFTPRRTPGSAQTPRSQKRVARMDKIMSDIMRHKKIEAAERKSTPGRRQPGVGQRRGGLFVSAQRRALNQSGADKRQERPPPEPRPSLPLPSLQPPSTANITGERTSPALLPTVKQEPKPPVNLDGAADPSKVTPIVTPEAPAAGGFEFEDAPLTNPIVSSAPPPAQLQAAEPASQPPPPPVVPAGENFASVTEKVTAKMDSLSCDPSVVKTEPVDTSAPVSVSVKTEGGPPAPVHQPPLETPPSAVPPTDTNVPSQTALAPAVDAPAQISAAEITSSQPDSATAVTAEPKEAQSIELKLEPVKLEDIPIPMETDATASQPTVPEGPTVAPPPPVEKMET